MRGYAIRRLATLVLLGGLLIWGCSDDDSPETPGNGGTQEPMTAEEISDAVASLSGGLATTTEECAAEDLLDQEANADMFDYFLGEVVGPVISGESIADYYGTYDDTSPSRQDGSGVERISAQPNNAVKLTLVGTDSLGNPLSGDLTVSNIVFEADTSAQTMHVVFAGTVHESSGDMMAFNFSLNLAGEIDPEGGDISDLEMDLGVSGSMCALSYQLNLDIDGESNIVASGFYQEEVKVSFRLTANTTPPDSTMTMKLWIGPEARPTVAVYIEANTSDENCVSGYIVVNGQQQATLTATGCNTEEMQVYAVVEGEQVPVEDVFDELSELLEELGLLDIELPFGSFGSPAPGTAGPLGLLGHPAEWQTVLRAIQ